MLFQGEEWAASTPWPFFTSHPEPELGLATAQGRIAEFARMGWDPAAVADPQDPRTFQRAKLDWAEAAAGDHSGILDLYRSLARLRRERPELTDPAWPAAARVHAPEGADAAHRAFELARGEVRVLANLTETPWAVDVHPGEVVLIATDARTTVDSGVLALPPDSAAVVGPAR